MIISGQKQAENGPQKKKALTKKKRQEGGGEGLFGRWKKTVLLTEHPRGKKKKKGPTHLTAGLKKTGRVT